VWLPALVAMLLAFTFVAARLLIAADGDASRFAVVGSTFAPDVSQVPPSLHVYPNSDGYDGQFFYRLALDPSALDIGLSHGISFDDILRSGRIGYPAVTWAVAVGGRPQLVQWALIAINVAGIGAIGALGGALAHRYGRHAGWGLLLAGYWGFAFSVSRDLSEIMAATATLAGLVLLLDRKHLAAAVAFCVAVLTREQALLTAGLFSAGALVSMWRAEPRPLRERLGPLLPLLLPPLSLAAWSAVVYAVSGDVPLTSSSSSNFGIPFVGLFDAMRDWVGGVGVETDRRPFKSSLNFLQLAALVLVLWCAVRSWRVTRMHRELWFAAAGMFILFICLTPQVLDDPANFRTIYDLYLLGVLLVLASGRSLRVLAYAVPAVSFVSAIPLVVRI
jgi:hypothetical protein